jgi:hypothetical protein
VGLPSRIAIPIIVVFAAVFLGIMGYLLKVSFGTTGSAFGAGQVAQQGDARIQATPAPIATDPPGTFTVPQTGTGPMQGQSSALPGASVGGGPPAPVMQQVQSLRERIARNPKDLAALVQMGDMEFDAQKYDKAADYLQRALALDPSNPDVRTDYASALHQTGHDLDALAQLDTVLRERPKFVNAVFNRGVVLQAIGRRTDAAAAFRQFITLVPSSDPRVATAKEALQQLNG